MQCVRQRERIRSMWRTIGGVGRCHSGLCENPETEQTSFLNRLWAKPNLTAPDILTFSFDLCYILVVCLSLPKWSRTVTTLPTASGMKPVAVSRVVQCAARRKGSASSGCGAMAGESPCLSLTNFRWWLINFSHFVPICGNFVTYNISGTNGGVSRG